MQSRDCRRRAEKQNNNGRQGDSVLKGGGEGGRWRDRASKGSSGSCDSLGPTLMYATTVWQRCVISLCVCVCCCWGVRPAIRTFQPFFALAGKNCVKCELHSVSWWCSYVLTVLVPTQPYTVCSIWNAAHYVLETVSFYDTQVVPGDAERVVSSSLQRNCFIFALVPVPVWQLLDFKMKSIWWQTKLWYMRYTWLRRAVVK